MDVEVLGSGRWSGFYKLSSRTFDGIGCGSRWCERQHPFPPAEALPPSELKTSQRMRYFKQLPLEQFSTVSICLVVCVVYELDVWSVKSSLSSGSRVSACDFRMHHQSAQSNAMSDDETGFLGFACFL